MLDSAEIALFLSATLLLLVIPGPAVTYIVTRSMSEGRRAGLVSTLGIAAGGLVHVAAAALGVSAILSSSALAFSIVKYAGAAYLIGLGVKTILGKPETEEEMAPLPATSWTVFWQGALVNVLNPKTALFFLAFLPQFVSPAKGSVAAQMAFLGTVFVLLAVCTDGIWALVAGSAAGFLRRKRGLVRSSRYVTGSVYVGLGLATAFAGPSKK